MIVLSPFDNSTQNLNFLEDLRNVKQIKGFSNTICWSSKTFKGLFSFLSIEISICGYMSL